MDIRGCSGSSARLGVEKELSRQHQQLSSHCGLLRKAELCRSRVLMKRCEKPQNIVVLASWGSRPQLALEPFNWNVWTCKRHGRMLPCFLVCYERQLLKAENLDEELEDWCSEMQQPPKYQAKALLWEVVPHGQARCKSNKKNHGDLHFLLPDPIKIPWIVKLLRKLWQGLKR